MDTSILDFRKTPRIILQKPKKISGDIEALLLDVSNRGICFLTASDLDQSKLLNRNLNIEIEIFSKLFKFSVVPIWKKNHENSKGSIYGASIIKSENVSTAIIKMMLYEQFRNILRNIKLSNSRQQLMRFCKNLGRYVLSLAELDENMEKNIISEKETLSRLKSSTDFIVQEGEKLKLSLNDKLATSKLKKEFRKVVAPWAYKSVIVKHSYDKPRGYPGDYETLEVIYDRKVITTENNLGRIFDIYFLNNPYADAVRNRKDYIKNLIKKVLDDKKRDIKILNLACGSCRELRELLIEENQFHDKEIKIVCLDWEKEALAYSRNALKNLPKNIQIEWLEENILNYAKTADFFKLRGQFDLIYSIGLADYLPDRINKKIIQTSFNGLSEGGRLVFAHKNREIAFSHLPPEWFCDWEFIPRNQNEVLTLLEPLNLKDAKVQIDWDSTKDVFFINLIKNNSESIFSAQEQLQIKTIAKVK